MAKILKIVFVSPGPVYKPESSAYQNRFTLLSEKMSGYILTTSNSKIEVDIGNFHFSSVKRMNGKLLNFFGLWWHCISFAFLARKNKNIDCIVTYDPLKTGLIGCVMKFIIGIPLVVEVNGVYTSPAVWADEPNSFLVLLKKKMVPVLMSFVFRCADGLKLQFGTQIEPFKRIVSVKIVKNFPDFTPIERFSNLGEKEEILLVGFPFRLKGVDLLVEAFKKVSPQFPDWQLKILGWYPEPKELMEAIDNHPKIKHLPPVHYKDMPNHIGWAGIIAQPSRTDALPRVLVEAAAAGKPRIGSRVDGIPVAIEDKLDGLLVESENVDELAKALSVLMGDKTLRQTLGRAAATKAETVFSSDVYLDNTYNLYTQVIQDAS